MSKYIIYNGTVLTEQRAIKDGAVCIENGIITSVLDKLPAEQEAGVEYIDAGGRYISPGFIDIHIHGGAGGSFMARTTDEVIAACQIHMRHGTTSIVPTTYSAQQDAFDIAATAITEVAATMTDGPNILGIHMEGPYFSPNQCGAMLPEHVRNPVPEEYLTLLDKYPNIIRWSIAPELPGAIEMAAELSRRGVQMSIGHSDALYEDTIKAFENGFTSITHLYSCTTTVRRINAYRYAGINEAAYWLDDMYVEVIADGKHLPASLLKLIYKLKGPDHICLVTDSNSPGGLDYEDGSIVQTPSGPNILIEDGVAKLLDRSAFAGSIATTDRLVRNMIQLADVPVVEAVRMISATPAKLLGVFDRKGSIAVGKDADIVIFDENVNVDKVLVGGKVLVGN